MQHLIDVNTENFRQAVVEPSRDLPVLVDYYAPDCAPCQMLRPILERIAEEYDSRVKLVTVNIADNPDLAQRYKIHAIPTVQAFVDGKRVDEFYGALPINLVRDFVERFFPSAASLLIKQAEEQQRHGHLAQAKDLLDLAVQLYPDDSEPRMALAWHYVRTRQPEKAWAIAQVLPDYVRSAVEGQQLNQAIVLTPTRDLPQDLTTLEDLRTARPEDVAVSMQLARHYVAAGMPFRALDELLDLLARRSPAEDDAPRQLMLTILNSLPPSPSVREYRRKLAHLLF